MSTEKHVVVEDRNLDELLEQAIARAIHSNGATPRRLGVGEVVRQITAVFPVRTLPR